jgi:predicted  nucleic acid-binding Zn-ribbon protein
MLPSQAELIALLQQTQGEHQAIKDQLSNLTLTHNNINVQLQQANQEVLTRRAWNEDLQKQLFGTEAGTSL